jgi:MFS family permease
MTDKYSFLVLRALSGISAACSIPASYRLITAFFDRHELPRAFTIYTLSGSIGASLGVLLAGGVELIKADGQLSGWRWYFRITCLIV